MEEYVPALSQSIFSEGFIDTLSEITEVGIDSVIAEGLLKDFPLASVVLSTSRTIVSIRERNLLKNTAIFINELKSHSIDEQKLLSYKAKIQDKKKAEQELGRVLILLDQYVDNVKSRMLGVLFRRYVNQEFIWDKFCELSDTIGRLFLSDISYIEQVGNTEENVVNYHIHNIPYNIKRLEGLGLIELYGQYARFGDRLLQAEEMCAGLTENGKALIDVFHSL